MPAFLTLEITCDKCGVGLFAEEQRGSEAGLLRARWHAQKMLKADRAMIIQRKRGHTIFYCQKCADGERTT